jgi:hypothetical protein
MNDIEQLTLVVASGMLLIIHRIPEDTEKINKMGLGHLTIDLGFIFVLTAGIVIPVMKIIISAITGEN